MLTEINGNVGFLNLNHWQSYFTVYMLCPYAIIIKNVHSLIHDVFSCCIQKFFVVKHFISPHCQRPSESFPLTFPSHDPSNSSPIDPARNSKSYPKITFTHSSSDDRDQTCGEAFRTARSSNRQSIWSPAVKGDSVRYGRYTLVRCLVILLEDELSENALFFSGRNGWFSRNSMRCG